MNNSSLYLVYLLDAASEPHPLLSFAPLIFMFGIFYFLLIRPQQKKQKDHKLMTESLQKNQQVITSGGIHGVITLVKETTVVLRLDEKVKVEFDKSAISVVSKA